MARFVPRRGTHRPDTGTRARAGMALDLRLDRVRPGDQELRGERDRRN
jgi:hypothetical protein